MVVLETESKIRQMVLAKIPAKVFANIQESKTPLLEAARDAITAGATLPMPDNNEGGYDWSGFSCKFVSVTVTPDVAVYIINLANSSFSGKRSEAAGWVLTRGLGYKVRLPDPKDLLKTIPTYSELLQMQEAEQCGQLALRYVNLLRRTDNTRSDMPAQDLPAIDSAPNGDELRALRDKKGVSQRDTAAAVGLTRGLVAEVERGKRKRILTRQKIAEALNALPDKPK